MRCGIDVHDGCGRSVLSAAFGQTQAVTWRTVHAIIALDWHMKLWEYENIKSTQRGSSYGKPSKWKPSKSSVSTPNGSGTSLNRLSVPCSRPGAPNCDPICLKFATAAAFTQVLDHYEVSNGATPASTTHSTKSESLTFDASNIPNMLHTKLLKGCFDGNSPKKATWDAMVALALVSVFSSSGSVEELRRVSGANVAQGKKEAGRLQASTRARFLLPRRLRYRRC